MDGLVLLSVLLAQGVSAPASAALQVEASLAFGGNVNVGEFSELHIRALSSQGGRLHLETSGAAPSIGIDFDLLPNEMQETWLPLRIDSSATRLSLGATLSNSITRDIPIEYARRSQPRLALFGPRAAQQLSHLPGAELVSAKGLPHLQAAYGQISALAVDSQALATLDEPQLRALLEYVGTCGRVLLIDASAAVSKAFTNRAACEGRFLGLPGNDANAEVAFISLLEQASFGLPAEQNLELLLGESSIDTFNWTRLAVFLLGYLTILALLSVRSRSRYATMGFSILSTILVLLIWPAGKSRDFVAWAEMASTEQVAHYIGLERQSTTRRDSFQLSGADFNPYASSTSTKDYALQWGVGPGQQSITWQAKPFQRLRRISHGSFPVNATIQLELRGDRAGICNTGTGETKPMHLQWQGVVYEVPALQEKERWIVNGQEALNIDPGNQPELRLFLERSTEYALTVLQSLSIPGAENNQQAWLLRYQSHQNGASPCAG